jgi:hypothetical protein
MKERKILLFKFDVPEIARLEAQEQQRILDLCWASPLVQEAWKRYWGRPLQFSLIPIVPLTVYWTISDRNLGLLMAIVVPIAVGSSFMIRPYYRRRLVGALRASGRSHLRGLANPDGETSLGDPFSPTASPQGKADLKSIAEMSEASPVPAPPAKFSWGQYKGRLILMVVCWVMIVVLTVLRRYVATRRN